MFSSIVLLSCVFTSMFTFYFRIDNRDIDSEVNEYLSRAIDARSIERLRAEHATGFFMKFRKKHLEDKVGFCVVYVSSFCVAYIVVVKHCVKY